MAIRVEIPHEFNQFALDSCGNAVLPASQSTTNSSAKAAMAALIAARTPRTVWVELTSKCPFDCLFCSRKTRRGSGEHMPFALFQSLLAQLSDPRTLLLNYSGESTVYPELVSAIQLARSTGAFVELVSALASVSEAMLPGLSQSGLNRLTVSIHATDPDLYSAIYGYSSFETLRSRLTRFLELSRRKAPPIVDIAFVAMNQNLGELSAVAGLASSLGLRDLSIFPVIRRDEIPIQFPTELTVSGDHRPAFEVRVRRAVADAAQLHPGVSFHICNPSFDATSVALGEVPVAFPGPLPEGARIHSCEQSPWETAHVLSNGDVVACEVLDKKPLGNLTRQTLAEIWHGNAYRQFRESYHLGKVPECRTCPWKRAYRPGPLASEIVASRGRSAQLLHGWHEPSDEPHIWSSQQAVAVLPSRPGSRRLHLCGMLPPGLDGSANVLTVSANGEEVGRVENPWDEVITVGVEFPLPECTSDALFIELRTQSIYRPRDRGAGPDQRDLGFGLIFLASKPSARAELAPRWKLSLQPLIQAVRAADALGTCLPRRPLNGHPVQFGPGLSVIIPERDNIVEFEACLDALARAAKRWREPLETIVVVNGAGAQNYDRLRSAHPDVNWQFHRQPLGFSGAIGAGLREVRFDWVYLLNSDVVLDPAALETIGACRDGSVFAAASQIVYKDVTRFRDETNWTELFVENGLATIHDHIPQSTDIMDSFYAGGAASLFQTRLLRRFAQIHAYDPFYWEDVEWGWRARKLGYRTVFCPRSVAHHSRRSTISKLYSPDEVESVLERNRLLFQLRNFTRAGSLHSVFDAVAQSAGPVREYFRDGRVVMQIVRSRLWNHIAPLTDEQILESRR